MSERRDGIESVPGPATNEGRGEAGYVMRSERLAENTSRAAAVRMDCSMSYCNH